MDAGNGVSMLEKGTVRRGAAHPGRRREPPRLDLWPQESLRQKQEEEAAGRRMFVCMEQSPLPPTETIK